MQHRNPAQFFFLSFSFFPSFPSFLFFFSFSLFSLFSLFPFSLFFFFWQQTRNNASISAIRGKGKEREQKLPQFSCSCFCFCLCCCCWCTFQTSFAESSDVDRSLLPHFSLLLTKLEASRSRTVVGPPSTINTIYWTVLLNTPKAIDT